MGFFTYRAVLLAIYLLGGLCSVQALHGQNNQLLLVPSGQKVEIPFSYINGFIVIKAILAGNTEVNLLLDTGAENLILFNKSILDKLGISPGKEILLKGADLSQDVKAQICRKIPIQINKANLVSKDFIVLEENYLNFEETIGIGIAGLIGGRMLWGSVLNIDYKKRKIVLYDKNIFEAENDPYVQTLDLEIVDNKPYIQSSVQLYTGEEVPIKLLLDTGSSLGFLLFYDTHKELQLPPYSIEGPLARGLGGYIQGYLATIKTLRLNNSLYFNSLITNYQKLNQVVEPRIYNNRNGIIGNPLLSRFNVTIDYVDNKLYLKAIKNYNKAFDFDRSGMIVCASGPKLSDFIVKHVLKGSPAYYADIRPGDKIHRINWVLSKLSSLDQINKKLKRKEGSRMKIILVREGEKISKKIILQDCIRRPLTGTWNN